MFSLVKTFVSKVFMAILLTLKAVLLYVGKLLLRAIVMIAVIIYLALEFVAKNAWYIMAAIAVAVWITSFNRKS